MLGGGRLWRHADFVKLWVGQTISVVGSQVTTLALPTIAILLLHATAAQVGLLAALERVAFRSDPFGPFRPAPYIDCDGNVYPVACG